MFYLGKKIQIILTSHSPFLLSDLPHSNVILIEKDNMRSSVVSELEDMGLTFAGNIHTLLSHSFFMQDGLMGNFARYKINKVLNKIINLHQSDLIQQRIELYNIINFIGERVIRNKLKNLLDDKLEIDLHEEFIKLKLRLDNLEGQNR
ncbi:hypothetical protein [Metabacillus fastidiosus]|uniref:hypothetical protein n=1 Tax=Metabacillus fastidiosus TaxID=1458 RepID=UPI002DBEE7B7|nr:hypothetical protein [Metabacillus fastidiosus]MEC2078605.1 hypothetical protein [Metabacillus fastidiosus]